MKEYQTYLQNVNIVSVTSVFAVHKRVFSHVLLVVQTWLLSPSLIFFYCVLLCDVCPCVSVCHYIITDKENVSTANLFWECCQVLILCFLPHDSHL